MKKFNRALILSGLTLMASTALAETGQSYFTVEYSQMDMSFDTDSANPGSLFFRLGKQVDSNFAVEMYLGLGVTDDEIFSENYVDFFGSGTFKVDAELAQAIGVQAKYIGNISPTSDFFAAVGYGKTEVDFRIEDCIVSGASSFCDEFTVSDSDNDLVYQLGLNFDKLTLSYNVYYDDTLDGTDVEISSFNIGYRTSFY